MSKEIQFLPQGWKLQSPNQLDVLAVGSRVTVGDGISANVTAVMIDADGVQYRVVWWDGARRVSEYLVAFEVQPVQETRVRIGFRLPTCDLCGLKGHFERNCPEKRTNELGRRSQLGNEDR